MSSFSPSEELVSLAVQLTDGDLDESGRESLREIVAADKGAARWLVEWLELNAILDFDFGNQDKFSATSRLLQPPEKSVAAESESRSPHITPSASTKRVNDSATLDFLRSNPWLSSAAAVLMIAVCVLGLSTAKLMDFASSKDSPVADLALAAPDGVAESVSIATVAGGVDAVFGDGISLGSRLSAGIVRLEKGVAQIAFDRGAVLVLEGPAELELVDATTCRLLSGSLSAELLPVAAGFSVAARGIQVSDQETRFGLRCGPQHATEVHAFGADLRLVDFHGASGQERKLLAGQAIRWHENKETVRFDSNPDSFVTREELARRQRMSDQRAYARWADYSQRWLHDPDVILRYEFGIYSDGQIVNTTDSTRHLALSRQATPRWIAGRWFDKHSMLFDGRTDVLEIADQPELRLKESFSLAVWLRSRAYPRSGWGRIVGKGVGTDRNYGLWAKSSGQFCWQVCPEIGPESQEVWDRHTLLTEVCPLDGWLLLVGVVDKDKSKVYVNGKLHNSGDAPDDIANSDDPLTIGFYSDVPFHNEYFCGELDELILLKRALSDKEIREMYETGRQEYVPLSGEEEESLRRDAEKLPMI